MLISTWDGKTTEFSFPQDCVLVFPTWPNSGDPVRRAGPFLTLPTLVSHSFYLSRRWEGVGLFVGQNKVSSLYFSIFHEELAWSLTCFLQSFPNQLQKCNNQLWKRYAIGKKGRRAMGLSPTKPTTNLSNRGGERGCDDTTINLTM